MKMSCNLLLIAALFIGTVCWVNPANAAVTLEVLNPRGEVPPPPVMGIRPRLNDLAGRKIALCENGKMGADVLFEAIAELLKQKYPTATILRMPKPQGSRFAFDAKDWYPEVARQADAFLFGVGD